MMENTDWLREDSNCYSAFYIASTALLSVFAGVMDMSMSRYLWRAALLALLPLLPVLGCQLAYRAQVLKGAALSRKICLFTLKTLLVLCCNVFCFFATAFFGMDSTGAITITFLVLLCVSALLLLLSFIGEIAAIIKAEREKNALPFDDV